MLLNSQSANDLISRMKYMKTAQQNNQKLLVQVQETKLNFEEQKNLREEKKIELDKLELQLNAQKDELDNQKVAKQKILADTQNDERIYQRPSFQRSSIQHAAKTDGNGSNRNR